MSYYQDNLCGKCQRSFDPDEGLWDDDGDFVCPKCFKDNQDPDKDDEVGPDYDEEDEEEL